MAVNISGTTVIDDSRNLTNVIGIKTVGGTSILGPGDIAVGGNYVMQSYISPATWTKPANLKAVRVTVIGGGAGVVSGGTGRGGGGAGGIAIEYLTAPAIPGPVTVTVGNGGFSSSPVVNGNTSSFGAFCSATGGSGGSSVPSPSPGAPVGFGTGGEGGVGSGGTININGQNGGTSYFISSGPLVVGGAGGSSILGLGGESLAGAGSPPIAANPGTGYGSGSSGTTPGPAPAGLGGTGKQGIVIVEEFY